MGFKTDQVTTWINQASPCLPTCATDVSRYSKNSHTLLLKNHPNSMPNHPKQNFKSSIMGRTSKEWSRVYTMKRYFRSSTVRRVPVPPAWSSPKADATIFLLSSCQMIQHKNEIRICHSTDTSYLHPNHKICHPSISKLTKKIKDDFMC